MSSRSVLATVLRHDRAIVVAGLAAVIVLAWAYLLAGGGMPMPPAGSISLAAAEVMARWTPGYAAMVFIMWAVMMAAMMLPSAAPVLLLHDRIVRSRNPERTSFQLTGLFALGYVTVWIAFSVAATGLQYGLAQASALSGDMRATTAMAAGSLLIAAGVYQLTPLKQACLRRCRSPLEFFAAYWQGGRRGAFAMGLRHGAFCLGCCWVLMLLLFVGGVMSLMWIAGLALFVAAEKLLPWGSRLADLSSMLLIAWGVGSLVYFS